MSSDLTRKEQLMFVNEVGKPELPVFTNPTDNKDYVFGPGTKIPDGLVKKAGKKTKKNKRKSKKRSFLKSRKVR